MRTVATHFAQPVDQSLTDTPVRQRASNKQHRRIRTLRNLAFKRLVGLCGAMVLLTLVMLVWQLVSQSMPLFFNPSMSLKQSWPLPDSQQVLLVDDLLKGRTAVVRDGNCHTLFKALDDEQQLVDIKRIPGRCVEEVKALNVLGENYLARLSANGLLRIESVSQLSASLSHRAIMSFYLRGKASPTAGTPLNLEAWHLAISDQRVMVSAKEQGSWRVFVVDREDPAQIKLITIENAEHITLLPKVGQIAVRRGVDWTFYDEHYQLIKAHTLDEVPYFITPMPGDRSLLLNFPDGRLQNWSFVNDGGQFVARMTAQYDVRHRITDAIFSPVSNAAVLLGEDNQLLLVNYVTAQALSNIPGKEELTLASWQGDQLYAMTQTDIQMWDVENLSAAPTWKSLAEKVWYEGYEAASYVWQTTYASDFQIAKYSIVPLLIGSFKAALLALVIAIPIATLAAIYTGYFAPGRLRAWLKPGIEMLEAIPSVVIGFIAAVWLAPLAEQFLLSMMLFVLLLPALLLLYASVQRRLVAMLPKPMRRGWEMLFIGAFLLVLAAFAAYMGNGAAPGLLTTLSDAIWNAWGEGYADKSTLVVALALGIAISPSIYTLAEDAIYEVPASLKQASFALGATRYQTLRNVVLVVAMPGLLSAITLGFGRAFGETMIVLMVSGNTPVAEWNPFEALRALTANLAIELPESEVGSAHFRILFLTALLLFAFTFAVNSVAEWFRVRLRRSVSHG